MKNPGFTHKLIRLLCASSIAVAVTILAQPPETGTTKSRPSGARPQVIYHLPPASNYAATLHSQAKSQNNELPVERSMPGSLQTSNANGNAAAAPSPTAIPQPERNLKPRAKSNRPQARQHSYGKSSGQGNGHGNHSHKK